MSHHSKKVHTNIGIERKPSPDETITILTRKASKGSATSSVDRTFLATGFGLRNLESLDRALREDEKRKQRELTMRERTGKFAQMDQGFGSEEEYVGSDRYSDVMSQTESMVSMTLASSSTSSKESKGSTVSKRLQYLMGIIGVQAQEEEASVQEWEPPKPAEEVEEQLPQTTEAMKQAQKYLRTHKIFELFQFLIAHLLSAIPENAIEFITDMLSKCLIFRAGYGEPPLLYNRRHIEELFNMMDPMRTGFITFNQYKNGMHTIGICTYNPDPPKNEDGRISKETFVEEAYDCLTDLLNDMIRRRGSSVKAPDAPPPSPYMQSQILWNGGSEGSFLSSSKDKEKK